MSPEVNDYIRVTSEGSPHDGLIGQVVATAEKDMLVLRLYGREVRLAQSELSVLAKNGSRAHSLISRKALHWDMNYLDSIGLYVLMDIALWLRDYEWCKDINQRMARIR
ncbi:hypothetical protein [Paenibacillus sp. NPDC057934]|uniref:hypothetical protein n=1 Tax=Paenibacillus sp. NPDC057934 TaxID=3346282 RepID=UPI0036DBB6CC